MSKARPLSAAKAVCLCLAAQLVLVGILFAAPRLLFYNPYSKDAAPGLVFTALTQLLSPNINNCGMSIDDDWSGFAAHTAEYYCTPAADFTLQSFRDDDEITFRFGRAYVTTRDSLYKSEPQSTFLEPKRAASLDNAANRPNDRYLAWVQFAESLSTEEFEQKYAYLFRNVGQRTNAFLWIPVKTSDSPSAPCLGVAGNAATYFVGNWFGFEPLDNQTLPYREAFFRRTVQLLSEKKEETSMFLASGLWGVKRLYFFTVEEYLKQNGCSYLGFVAYLEGAELVKISKDTNNTIFKVISKA